MAKHADSYHSGHEFDSSMYHNKTPLVRKATGNHLIKSISLEEFSTLSLVSAKLEIESSTQEIRDLAMH